MTDIIIIGAGPAGLSAAVYGLRAGLKVQVFDKSFYGGQVAITAEIENYPAVEKVTGYELAGRLFRQAEELGAEFVYEEILGVDFEKAEKSIFTSSGNTYQAKAIIIATGVKRRKLGCPGEEEFTGKGVSYCATCDGAFFKGKEVAIVGGGNTALEDALFLSNSCSKVTIIHRRDSFRGEKPRQDAVFSRKNISILFQYAVEAIKGEETVSAIKIKNLKDNTIEELPVSGVFVAIGMEPENGVFAPPLSLDDQGYFLVGEDCKTSIEGVFVAGDSRTKKHRQIITAASDGAIAALEAADYINLKG